MELIYVFSVIALFIVYMFIKKTDKKVDILKQIVLTIVLLFCYNTFICYVLTFFTIPVNLLGLGIINYIFAILGIIHLVKTKQRQKYSFNKLDLLYIVLIGIVTIIVAYLNFGFPLEIKYETADPATHFLTSELFEEEDCGLLAAEENRGFTDRKTASYVNSGLIMKCLENVISSFDFYKVFIIFGILILFLTGWMFYSSISRFAKNNVTRFLAFVIATLCLLGYPANSLFFGFEYLSMGVLIITAIIASIDTYQKEEISYKHNLLVFFLLNFGVFAAYFMFVPYIYSGLWLYFCINEYNKNKELNKTKEKVSVIKLLFTKKLIVQLTVTLLIPFFLGYIYHIAPEIYGLIIKKTVDLSNAIRQQNNLVSNQFSVYGYIYVNLFSNMVLPLVFAIITMYKSWKENRGVSIITLLALSFIFILLIGYLFEKVSMYYLNKNYFALWILLYYLAFKGLLLLYEENKLAPFLFVGLYIIAILYTLIFTETNISHGVVDEDENIFQVADIYGANKTILQGENDLNQEELNLLKYAKDNIPIESNLEVAGSVEQGFWTNSIVKPVDKDGKYIGRADQETYLIIVGLRVNKADYLIYFNRGYYYKLWKRLIWHNAEVVYQNSAGGILKYNK